MFKILVTKYNICNKVFMSLIIVRYIYISVYLGKLGVNRKINEIMISSLSSNKTV